MAFIWDFRMWVRRQRPLAVRLSPDAWAAYSRPQTMASLKGRRGWAAAQETASRWLSITVVSRSHAASSSSSSMGAPSFDWFIK